MLARLNLIGRVRHAAITSEADLLGYVVNVTVLCVLVALSVDIVNQMVFFVDWPSSFRSWAITTTLVLCLAAPITRVIAKAQLELFRVKLALAALNATNEAIARSRSREEMFAAVCEAATQTQAFTAMVIALVEPGEINQRVQAFAGPDGMTREKIVIPAHHRDPTRPNFGPIALETGYPVYTNDFQNDDRCAPSKAEAEARGVNAYAVTPMLRDGVGIGVMAFASDQRNAFNPRVVDLMVRLAENVVFAMEGFDRAVEQAAAEAKIAYLASHDPLTGLQNRSVFSQRLRDSLARAPADGRRPAILFMDLDRFKRVNDSLGHDAGDALLAECARRMKRQVGDRGSVARIGGDEFAVLIEAPRDRNDIEALGQEILSALNEPVALAGIECITGASIGAAWFPEDGIDAETLTANADKAMYLAKDRGKNGLCFFSREQKPRANHGLVLEQKLRHALEHEEFSLHYQAKVDAMTHERVSAEALLRWRPADMGMLPPSQFIPMAEETGLIVPIGRWALSQACAQSALWRRQGMKPIPIAVNISPRQFMDPHLIADIDRALSDSGTPGDLLQLEITESMMTRDIEHAVAMLRRIRERGVRIAIDDFGTGYSSMSLMKKLPIDTLKIDRSFVSDLPSDIEDRAIVKAIIRMGKALGLRLVAEGVETPEQAEFLRRNHCDELQGFLFSRPIPGDEFAAFMNAPATHPREARIALIA